MAILDTSSEALSIDKEAERAAKIAAILKISEN